MEFRRRAPRIKTQGWQGRCRLEGQPVSAWAECNVVDLSLLGIGVEIAGGELGDLVGHELVVEVQTPVGHSVRLEVVGLVRNQALLTSGRTRVGIEFDDLSDTEKEILKVVEQLKMFW